jgi:hypothetical protein
MNDGELVGGARTRSFAPLSASCDLSLSARNASSSSKLAFAPPFFG